MSNMRDSDHELAVDAIMTAFDLYGGPAGTVKLRSLVSDIIGCAESLASDYPEDWDRARAFLEAASP